MGLHVSERGLRQVLSVFRNGCGESSGFVFGPFIKLKLVQTQQFVDWELNKHFNVEQVHTALLADSTTSAQSLTSTAETPTEVFFSSKIIKTWIIQL